MRKDKRMCQLLIGSCLLIGQAVLAEEDLLMLSMEDLLNLEITSVAKKAQPLNQAAAAVHVITQEDIRRSGMNSIPELLRMVPGLHVARQNNNIWAISSRGFNSSRANKMLVLMDGRTLYTPAFSGVYWDAQDTLLEDIERIEVIRGPGSTLWGSNAVNGVINIITKNSRDTQGGLVSAHFSEAEQHLAFRAGHAMSEDTALRVYAKARKFDNLQLISGAEHDDAWDMAQAGFRLDYSHSSQDHITLQGDVYDGQYEQSDSILMNANPSSFTYINHLSDLAGFNLLTRWNRHISADSSWELQAYFDRADRKDMMINQHIDTFDLDFQYRFQMTDLQEITWGINYRHIEDELQRVNFATQFIPGRFKQDLYALFIQDEVSLTSDLTLTLGTKFEHNDYTGWETQPSLKMLWNLSDNHTLWGSVAKSVRTPSRSNRDMLVNAYPAGFDPASFQFMVGTIEGSDAFEAEDMLSFELGFRSRLSNTLSIDVAAFYNDYENLYSSGSGMPYAVTDPFTAPQNYIRAPISIFENNNAAETYGVELSANWQLSSHWRMLLAYSFLNVQASSSSGDVDNIKAFENSSPENQFQIRSYYNFSEHLELDVFAYYYDEVTIVNAAPFNAPTTTIADHTRLDVRLGWQVNDTTSLSLGGQNLLGAETEYVDRDKTPVEAPKSIYAKLEMKF